MTREKVRYYKNIFRLPSTPLRVKVVLVIVLAYLLCPIDIIPDFIPILGQLDDILIAGIAAAYIARTMSKVTPEPVEMSEASR